MPSGSQLTPQYSLGALSAEQAANVRTCLAVGEQRGVSYNALWAMMLLGCGENSWHTYGCNSGGYCGVFQLGSSWQRQHPYTDIAYWAAYAYEDGFYGHGGLEQIQRDHPELSPGAWTNLCQGAYVPSEYPAFGYYYDHYDDYGALLIKQYYHHTGQDVLPPLPGPTQSRVPPAPAVTVGSITVPATNDVDNGPIIRNAFYNLGFHGQRAFTNAQWADDIIANTMYCTEDGPNA